MIPVSFQFQSQKSEDEIRTTIRQEFERYGSLSYLNLYHWDEVWYAEVGFEPSENPVPPWLIPLIIGAIIGSVGVVLLPGITAPIMEMMMLMMMFILMVTVLYSVAYPMLPPAVKEKVKKWIRPE